MWIVFGMLSVIFSITNIYCAYKKKEKTIWLTLGALSFTLVTMLSQYAMINNWVNKEDWSALMDVVPSMYMMLIGYTIAMIGINCIALILYFSKNQSKQ